MNIIITGGHPSPAFALVEYAQSQDSGLQFTLIGRNSALRSTNQLALEQQTARSYGIAFFGIDSGRSNAHSFQSRVLEVARTLKSTWQVLCILRQRKPDVCMSFGSYVAIPTVLAARLLHIPIITHEQTQAAGSSNVLIAKLASSVAVSYVSSLSYFPKEKTVVTGLPLRPSLFSPHPKPAWMQGTIKKPLLLILGGSTGSHAINQLVTSHCLELAQQYVVIHQTGLPSDKANWLEIASNRRESLRLSDTYFPVSSLTAEELAWAYQHASVAISRSGANTVAELLAFSIPTIFIPLPSSARNEQLENARYACTAFSGNRTLEQRDAEIYLMSKLEEIRLLKLPIITPTLDETPHQLLIALISKATNNR